MTSGVAGDSLSTQKEISAEQKKFLTEVLKYYREFAGENADDECPTRFCALQRCILHCSLFGAWASA